jgi:beta-glucosidase
VTRVQDALFNDAFPRMIETGRAPPGAASLMGDTSEARGTCDFAGANLYGRTLLRFDATRTGDLFARLSLPDGARRGDTPADSPFGEAYPQGIGRVVERLARLGKPIYVLENGVPDARDRVRPWVVARAAAALYDVLRRGFDVRGYYHWTLVDNFEWAEGWSLRFGLVALDPATGARSPRGSAHLYGAIARANALMRADVARWAPEALAEAFGDPS